MKRTRLDDVELAWEEHGAGERALVLVHGFTGSRRDFAPRVAALAAFGRTVLPDLRGHGGSTHSRDPERYTLEQLVADLVAFVDAEGLAGCDLLGHSLGGMVALRAALAAPERFGSLILMNTAARAPALPRALFDTACKVVEAAGLETLLTLMRQRDPAETGRTAADLRLEAEWGEGYWSEWRLPNFRAMDPVAYGALGAALFEQEPLGARLAELCLPTLVLVGDEDDAFLPAADELAAGIPGARRVTIPGAGHQPQLEAPETWLEAIRGHLAQVRGPASVARS